MANMGFIMPRPGFLAGIQELCRQSGALFILDEVITGFRLGIGGAQGAWGLEPDLTCLGKVIGGGLPLGAYGGKRAIMEMVAPAGPVYQAGTLSGNPLATTAGLATLRTLLEPGVFAAIETTAARIGGRHRQARGQCGDPHTDRAVRHHLRLLLPQGGGSRDRATPHRPNCMPTPSDTRSSSISCWSRASTSRPVSSKSRSPVRRTREREVEATLQAVEAGFRSWPSLLHLDTMSRLVNPVDLGEDAAHGVEESTTMMAISTRGRYSLRILILMASQPQGHMFTKHEIAEAEAVPYAYVQQLMINAQGGRVRQQSQGKSGRLHPCPSRGYDHGGRRSEGYRRADGNGALLGQREMRTRTGLPRPPVVDAGQPRCSTTSSVE